MPSSPSESTRTYEIEGADGGRIRVEVNENWKVTYGPVVGSDKTAVGRVMAFRVWESETKQRMLITNVAHFRDLSIPMTVQAIRPFGWSTWHALTETWFRPEHLEHVEVAWKNADEVSDRDIRPTDLDNKPLPGDSDEDDWNTPVSAPTSWRSPRSRKP